MFKWRPLQAHGNSSCFESFARRRSRSPCGRCASSAADLAIVGALVYASPEAAPIHDATLLVRDGRIARVAAAREVAVPRDTTVIDARGTTVVAGFWNSHVHLIGNELRDAERRPPPAAQAALERMLTRWGFTTAFELAGVPGNALALSRRIARGELRGPLLLSVDAPFYPRGGTPVYVRELYARHGWPGAEVADAEQARDRARRQLAAGAHGVKLFTGAIVGPPIGVLPMIVDIARARSCTRRIREAASPSRTRATCAASRWRSRPALTCSRTRRPNPVRGRTIWPAG